ncbi:MAG: protease modulator HflC [Mariniblastus sp.]
MNAKLTFVAFLVGLAAMAIYTSTYVVNEGKQVVITQFGKPVNFVTEPGLNFRIPLIQSVHRLEKRLLPWDGAPENMQTRDKKRIFVDCWARWRIVDLDTFFTNVRSEQKGQKILDDYVDSAVRDVIARNNLIDLVRTTNDKLAYETEELARTATSRDVVKTGREKLEKEILRVASSELQDRYGMELVAVHIKRVKYNDRVRDTVYERMRSERQRVAQLFESEADEQGNRIKGLTRKELDSIEGETKQKSDEIRGFADAEVIKLTAEAYGQNAEFFEFLQRLEMYKSALKSDTNLILSTDSEMFRLFKTTKAVQPLPAPNVALPGVDQTTVPQTAVAQPGVSLADDLVVDDVQAVAESSDGSGEQE